jgi:hypothetical protein
MSLPPDFTLHKIAEGADPLENPSGVITHFVFLNDSPPQLIERTRTEPEESFPRKWNHAKWY